MESSKSFESEYVLPSMAIEVGIHCIFGRFGIKLAATYKLEHDE